MHAVIIDDEVTIDIQLGAIVGSQAKAISARMFDPEFRNVVDDKPFDTVCNAWKPRSEVARRDIQAVV